jgi:hypothetical protein
MIQRISEDLLWSQIVARAWSDEDFMNRLRSDPRAALAEYGLELPQSMAIKVVDGPEARIVEDTDSVRHFILPGNPPDDLMEEDLVGDGVAWWCAGCARCGGCGCGCRACRC